jgi:light-regulated signal transduction histidine kinase (bacteriophytochrome)
VGAIIPFRDILLLLGIWIHIVICCSDCLSKGNKRCTLLEKMDNLFKTFYQVDTTLARKHGGTGLGLVICKGIIEDHGGMIWIDKDYTNGTSIKFTLPIASN